MTATAHWKEGNTYSKSLCWLVWSAGLFSFRETQRTGLSIVRAGNPTRNERQCLHPEVLRVCVTNVSLIYEGYVLRNSRTKGHAHTRWLRETIIETWKSPWLWYAVRIQVQLRMDEETRGFMSFSEGEVSQRNLSFIDPRPVPCRDRERKSTVVQEDNRWSARSAWRGRLPMVWTGKTLKGALLSRHVSAPLLDKVNLLFLFWTKDSFGFG